MSVPRPGTPAEHLYVAYGLRLRSALLLPELLPGSGDADVAVRYGPVTDVPAESRPGIFCFRATMEEAALVWSGVGAASIRGGAEITIQPDPDADEGALRLLVLGAALAFLLHQRGYLVLHASAVAVDGCAAGFLGQAGGGKSTTAAALHRRGHVLVSDDILAVDPDEREGPPQVHPGFPQLKLWPEAVEALGDSVGSLRRLRTAYDKRAWRARRDFAGAPLPLSRLYVLADAARLGIEPLPRQEALAECLRHSYGARILHALDPSGHFRRCARLVARTSVRRLSRPRDLDRLGELAALVERDARRGGPGSLPAVARACRPP